jgi:anti-sigma factor RsiW
MQDRYFSDEELVAYLDGEADFAPSDAIEAARTEDPALQARLDALALDHAALKTAFADLAPDQVIVPMATTLPGRRWSWPWAGLCAASVAAALVLGIAIGSSRNAPLQGWAEYVAAYQALYSTSTLSHIQSGPEAQQAELDRVGAAIGKSLTLSDLGLFPDVQYTRAQVLSFEGRPLIQLAFLTSTGDPVALCIIRSDKRGQGGAPELARMEGLSAARWAQSGYDYILIGGQDAELISRMSATFKGMQI